MNFPKLKRPKVKHKTRIPKNKKILIVHDLKVTRRGKLKIYCSDVIYYLRVENAKGLVAIWNGSRADKDLACDMLSELISFKGEMIPTWFGPGLFEFMDHSKIIHFYAGTSNIDSAVQHVKEIFIKKIVNDC